MRNPYIPIVRTQQLADGNFLQTIVGSSKAGSKKLQFPYEIPPIVVALTPETATSLYITAGILAAGAVGAVAISKL